MTRRILAIGAAVGLSVLVAGVGPAFAGGGGGLAPQEHWLSPPPESPSAEGIETGTLPSQDAENKVVDIDVRSPQRGGDPSVIDEAWRWRESGGE